MALHHHHVARPIIVDSVRTLIAAAQSARAVLPADTPDRHFYLGVEAAALGLLHPEIQAARTEEWLERQALPFREGYLRTQAELAAAMISEEWPAILPLPEPESLGTSPLWCARG